MEKANSITATDTETTKCLAGGGSHNYISLRNLPNVTTRAI